MSTNKWAIPAVVILLAVAAIGAWTYRAGSDASEAEGDIVANESVAPASGENGAAEPTLEETQPVVDEATVKPQDIKITVDGATPETPRSIGNVDAPVTMVEYSSLTCPHCAHAHETVLPRLIKDYVETGKLRIVFSDFPLNKEALDASKVSRCVANDQYFNFLTLLFGNIEKWAYSNNHPDALITNATLTGLPADKARACLEDKQIENALVASIQDANTNKGVNSTPTFIFNDGAKTIMGARDYSEFQAAIEDLLAGK